MRPHSIAIKGFTCFTKEVTISFEAMDVFAITGRTGSGKTTIMDAMCYALYGKVPRGTDVSRLVAHGAEQMYVSLEFDAGGRRYRAYRGVTLNKKTLKGPTRVQLERELADGEWEPLQDRVREMNTAIEEIIGLDFETFTRCVLLPQGRFQEMLAGKHEDRRKVLEELLDIGVYERIMQRANRERRDLDAQAKAIDGLLASAFADATEDTLEARRKELTAARPSLKSAVKERDALQQASQHAADVRAARRSEHERATQLATKQHALASAEALAASGQAQLDVLRDQAVRAETALRAIPYDRAMHTAMSIARGAAQQVERLATLAEQARAAAADSDETERANGALIEAQTRAETSKSAAVAADQALEDGRRAHAAAHLRAGLKAGDTCPVCTSTVGKLPKASEPALAALEQGSAAARGTSEQAATALNNAAGALALAKQRAEHAAATAVAAANELAAAERELAAQLPPGAPSAFQAISARVQELTEIAARVDALSADAERLRRQRDEHERSIADSAAATAGLRAESKALEDGAAADRAAGDAAIALLAGVIAAWTWDDVAGALAAKKDPTPAIMSRLDGAQKECAALERLIGKLEEETKRLERDIRAAEKQRAELAALRSQSALYATLADVLQANRFRDWYIGEAMTLLAEAASVRLQTLDPDLRFALHVREGEFSVVDRWQAGAERSPGTLSGGETFVVSLALALALAEQLPRIQTASATALESLFLDEGFGTLDADTLEPVMTALEGLRDEGRLVGIVTHVGELAERIGTRVEVTKSPDGSAVAVVGATPR